MSYPFELHPRLLGILGKQLVQKDVRALIELVKNAYDADATSIEVEWNGEKRELTIRDNGSGMSLEVIRKGWLVLGTPLKIQDKPSKRGRVPSGSKGLGRMAVAALGTRAIIETGVSARKWHTFQFDFEKLEREAARGRKPKVVVNKSARPPDALSASGTIIRISGTNALPDDAALDEMNRELDLLFRPDSPTARNVDRPSITVKAGSRARIVTPVDTSAKPPIRVVATVTSKVAATVKITPRLEVYQGPAEIKEEEYEINGDFSVLEGVRVEILWRPRGASPDENPVWQKGSLDDLGDHHGFHIYRDNVRVQPYGDDDADWLRMEATYIRTGAAKRYPRPIQVFAWAEISRTGDFDDNPSREGLRNTLGFRELRTFCSSVLEELQAFRQRAEPRGSRDPSPGEKEKDVEEAKSAYERMAERTSDDPEAKKDTEKLGRIFTRYEEVQAELSLVRERTSAGLVASLVLHDSGVSLSDHVALLDKAISRPCAEDFHPKVFRLLRTVVPRVVEGYELLRGASKSGGYRTSKFDASSTVSEIIAHFHAALNRPLTIEYTPQALPVNMREADIWSILVNLLHNAITSAEYSHAEGRQFPQHRRIVVDAKLQDGDLLIEVADNGPGLPKRPTDWIWERNNSTRSGGGSGLGLWLVRDIAQAQGGFTAAQSPGLDGVGARFTISIPQVGA